MIEVEGLLLPSIKLWKDEEAAYDTIYHKSKGVDWNFSYGFWSYGEEFFDMDCDP